MIYISGVEGCVMSDVPSQYECLLRSNPFLIASNFVDLQQGTFDICTRSMGFILQLIIYILFALRVNTCVELYNGKIDFSSLTNRVSKLERIAIGDATKDSCIVNIRSQVMRCEICLVLFRFCSS